MKDIDDLKDKIEDLTRQVYDGQRHLGERIAALESKSGAWGALAAIVVLILALLAKKLVGL